MTALDEKLLQRLDRLCRRMAGGNYDQAEQLFELTKTGRYPRLLTTLAESFGMMSVQVAAREFRLEGVIAELEQARARLEEYSRGLEETVARRTAEIREKNRLLETANDGLRARQKQLDDDLAAAAHIQRSLLPQRTPDADGYRFAWRFLPCEHIGGDLFSIQHLAPATLGVYLLDVMGHGVGSAMVTVSVHQSLLPQSGTVLDGRPGDLLGAGIRPPAEVLRRLDRDYPMDRFGGFFTMNYLLLETATGDVQYASAAHPRPLLLPVEGPVVPLEAAGSVIGLGGVSPFEQHRVRLSPGDRLFLHTDGITESEDADNRPLGQEGLCRLLENTRGHDLDDACRQVVEAALSHSGRETPADDITLLAIERRRS